MFLFILFALFTHSALINYLSGKNLSKVISEFHIEMREISHGWLQIFAIKFLLQR